MPVLCTTARTHTHRTPHAHKNVHFSASASVGGLKRRATNERTLSPAGEAAAGAGAGAGVEGESEGKGGGEPPWEDGPPPSVEERRALAAGAATA